VADPAAAWGIPARSRLIGLPLPPLGCTQAARPLMQVQVEWRSQSMMPGLREHMAQVQEESLSLPGNLLLT